TITRQAPLWFALTCSALLIWLGFVWLPAARVSYASQFVAAKLAPVFARLAGFIHPITYKTAQFVRRHHLAHHHTGLYDRDDLLELLNNQQAQTDNRIEKSELEIAAHALKFGDISIGERMTAWRKVQIVSLQDSLGPVVLDELHASGQSSFPVYDKNNKAVV